MSATKNPGDPPIGARSRTYSWDDPLQMGADARKLSGLDFLRHLIDIGARVPIGMTLGFRLAEVDEGRCCFIAEPEEYAFNPIGSIHGGYYSAVLDAALGVAVHTTLPAGHAYTTLEFKVNVVRPVAPGSGACRVEGRVIHRGKRVATSEAMFYGPDGKLCAHATSTCLVMEL